MNHCAFCLAMHSADARRRGISEREQAALALTEEMTDLTGPLVSDEVYARTAAACSERELGQVVAMALTINAWNRIGATTRLPLRRH